MDLGHYFEEPVTEEMAPGYRDHIKHPMCFQVPVAGFSSSP